jgi:hypothetical protein
MKISAEVCTELCSTFYKPNTTTFIWPQFLIHDITPPITIPLISTMPGKTPLDIGHVRKILNGKDSLGRFTFQITRHENNISLTLF